MSCACIQLYTFLRIHFAYVDGAIDLGTGVRWESYGCLRLYFAYEIGAIDIETELQGGKVLLDLRVKLCTADLMRWAWIRLCTFLRFQFACDDGAIDLGTEVR